MTGYAKPASISWLLQRNHVSSLDAAGGIKPFAALNASFYEAIKKAFCFKLSREVLSEEYELELEHERDIGQSRDQNSMIPCSSPTLGPSILVVFPAKDVFVLRSLTTSSTEPKGAMTSISQGSSPLFQSGGASRPIFR